MTALDSTESYTIGWVAALPIERAAATASLDDRHQPPASFEQHPSNTNSYTWGRMGNHNIVIASLPDGVYGSTAAATTASNLLASLPQIRIGLLVGIGGGIARHLDQDVRLGDVVVSRPEGATGGVIQYDLGKARLNGKWELKGMLNKPPQVLLSALAALRAEHEMISPKIPDLLEAMWTKMPQMKKPKKREPGYVHQGFENDRLFSSAYNHIDGQTCDNCDSSEEIQRDPRDTTDPNIHYGIIASGNTLVKDASTRDKIAELAGSECICAEMEAAGLMDRFPCLVIRGICDYADSHKNDRWQRYASATAATYAKELLQYVPIKLLENTTRAVDIVKSISNDIKGIQFATAKMQEGVQNLYTTVLNANQTTVLDRLRIAKGASFDSYAQEHTSFCLPNTRVELLQQIIDWAKDASGEPVFWLNGMAGTGKSTISRTVARLLADEGRLGASFFFKNGEADRGTLSKFFTTIAADLAVRKPYVASRIKDILDADPSITTKNAGEQFDKLLLQPLLKTATEETPIAFIIDALDECERDDDVRLLLRLFTRFKTELPRQMRIFLTSRPELPIRCAFQKIQGTYQGAILHEVPQPMVARDISLFLKHELARIREDYNDSVVTDQCLSLDWPSQSTFNALLKMAVPLFIVATTICRFISDRRMATPRKQLEKVFSRAGAGVSQLDGTYRAVLNNLIAGLFVQQQEQIIQEFRKVVGTIVLLASPLSTSALAKVLDLSREDIDSRLALLHSVLSIPSSADGPVRLFHLSFRDFLLDPEDPTMPFRVNEKQTHVVLATNCLRIVSCLKQDICGIKSPGTPRSEISEKIESCLPPEVQYSCLYWIYHLEKADMCVFESLDIHVFLTKHFLHWIEALALIGRVSESLGLLRKLQSRFQGKDSSDVSYLLEDAVRFIQTHMSALNIAPLQLYFQLYSSLLVFTPKHSKTRTIFTESKDRATWILLEPRIGDNWSLCQQTLEGHSGAVQSVSFSHNSTLVASGSSDKTVRIWLADTGECVQTLKGHSNWVQCVVFSHDSTLVASASDDKTVWIWRADTGECVQTLKGHSRTIRSVAFSHDSALVASASDDKTVRIWHTDTGKCMQTLQGHHGPVRAVVFSHDLALVVSASADRRVRIWCADTGQSVQTLKGHCGSVRSVAFSHDSALLASSSADKTVRIWHVDTGKCVQTLQGHSRAVRSVVFSHDSALIASASSDKTVRIWCAYTGECMQTLEGHASSLWSVDFSHDSALIASGSSDKTVRIWHTDKHEYVETRKGHRMKEGHSKAVRSVAFSHDSALVASASDDRTVRIWLADTGECMQTLKGHSRTIRSVTFSHDSALVASASDDKTVRIWNANTGQCIQTLEGHSGSVQSVAFSDDLALLASSSDDKTVRIWCADTGECIQTLQGHSLAVRSVAFSHDSALVASAFSGKTLWTWCADMGECVQAAKVVRISRRLTSERNSSHAVTEFGTIATGHDGNTDAVMPPESSRIGISEDNCWITWDKKKMCHSRTPGANTSHPGFLRRPPRSIG